MLAQINFAQSLEITLTFDKSAYLEYELSKPVLELKNVSSHDVPITQPFETEAEASGIEVELTDIYNKKIPAINMACADILLTKPIILKPGKSLFTLLPFSSHFGRKRPDGAVDFFENRYPEPGKYKIHVTYSYMENDKRTTISSNIVELEINAPTQEDMVVYRELKNARINAFYLTQTQKITNLLQLIKKYPNHVYMLLAYENAILYADLNPTLHVNTDELRLQMYKNFPTSIISLLNINQMLKNDSKLMESVMSKLSEQGNEKKEMFERYIEFIDKMIKQN